MNRTAEYNRRLAALSQEAAAGRAWVAGDIAPTGLFLAPLGEASFEELVDIYTEQAAGLEGGRGRPLRHRDDDDALRRARSQHSPCAA